MINKLILILICLLIGCKIRPGKSNLTLEKDLHFYKEIVDIYNDTSICFISASSLSNGEVIYSELQYLNNKDSNRQEQIDTYLNRNNILYKRINGILVQLIDGNSISDTNKLIYSYYDLYYKSVRKYYIKIEPINIDNMTIYKFMLSGDNFFSDINLIEYFSFKYGFIRKERQNFNSVSRYYLYQTINYHDKKSDTIQYKFNWKW